MTSPRKLLHLSTMLAAVNALRSITVAVRRTRPSSMAFTAPPRERRGTCRDLALAADSPPSLITESGYARPAVQWYPGHIAKAERALAETLKAVDVVVEVRDARIPRATSHPMVAQWAAARPRLVVLTHGDVVPGPAKADWLVALPTFGWDHPDGAAAVDRQVQNQARQAQAERDKYRAATTVDGRQGSADGDPDPTATNFALFVNAKQGTGVKTLIRNIVQAGAHVQERRRQRGLLQRPLRVGVIGYPNVGKSQLINKLIGRNRAKTANKPGVTRSLQWIRVKTESKKNNFELLDSPGIIPATLVDQSDAALLAACNCIGDAAYDNQAVASYLAEWLLTMHRHEDGALARQYAPQWRDKCIERYKFDPLSDTTREYEDGMPRTGEDILFDVADATCQGNPEDAARKILQDFRSGRMGPICLQIAPTSDEDRGQRRLSGVMGLLSEEDQIRDRLRLEAQQEQAERARMAREAATLQGLVLPPIVRNQNEEAKPATDDVQVGKGMFDGW